MNKKMRGYFTVEAAMVLPIVIGTIVFILYVQLYWYDRCLMDQETAMISVVAAKEAGSGQQELDDALRSWMKEHGTEMYVLWQRDDIAISQKHDQIKLRRSGSLLTDHMFWDSTVSYENRIIRPSSFLRLCRRMKQA